MQTFVIPLLLFLQVTNQPFPVECYTDSVSSLTPECPPTSSLAPCECLVLGTQRMLRCDGRHAPVQQQNSLGEILRTISSSPASSSTSSLSSSSRAIGNSNSPQNSVFFSAVSGDMTQVHGNSTLTDYEWLHLLNWPRITNFEERFFGHLHFRMLIIENFPLLKKLHPNCFRHVRDRLRSVYAYNTALDDYRERQSLAPFSRLRRLTNLQIASAANICPPKEIIKPCKCSIEREPLTPKIQDQYQVERQRLQLQCQSIDHLDLRRIFKRLTSLHPRTDGGEHSPTSGWYFDTLILRNFTGPLRRDTFGAIQLGELRIERSKRLFFIESNAFAGNCSLQRVQVAHSVFDPSSLGETFLALNRLSHLRSLNIWNCHIDFIPEFAFAHLQNSLKELIFYGNTLQAIGSYAFNGLRNLEQLKIDGNQLLLVDKFAFGSNYTPTRHALHISLASNNLANSTLQFQALAGAQRPLHLSLAEAGGCQFAQSFRALPEAVFSPFLDVPWNRLYLEPECMLDCRLCEMQWLLELPKSAQKRVKLRPESNYSQPQSEKQKRRSLSNDHHSSSQQQPITQQQQGFIPCLPSLKVHVKLTGRENNASEIRSLLNNTLNLFEIQDDIDWKHCN